MFRFVKGHCDPDLSGVAILLSFSDLIRESRDTIIRHSGLDSESIFTRVHDSYFFPLQQKVTKSARQSKFLHLRYKLFIAVRQVSPSCWIAELDGEDNLERSCTVWKCFFTRIK
jgi:hypothetical protein